MYVRETVLEENNALNQIMKKMKLLQQQSEMLLRKFVKILKIST